MCFWDVTEVEPLSEAVFHSRLTLGSFSAQFMFCGGGFFYTWEDLSWRCEPNNEGTAP